jgi:AraC family transcriptional regulator, regulatory protein of adaptative response / methylated-DNA-[protein]-cysteine methyltransferase
MRDAGHNMAKMDWDVELNGPADLAAFLRPDGPLRATWVYTPIGGMIAVCSDVALHMLEFPRRARLALQLPRLRQGVAVGRTTVTDHLQAELTAYFAGRRPTFSTPLALQGTAFTLAVWAALQAVPYGTTQTYAGLATALHRPTAARAVGRANGANPIAILVPCHRMLGMQGALTGYAGGLWRKEWLLAHESQR